MRVLWRAREDPRVDLGPSPRAGLMLLRAAKAHAMMNGRDHALPDDVQALAEPVLAHRLVLAPETPRDAAAGVIADAIRAVTSFVMRALAGMRRAAGVALAGLALILIALDVRHSAPFVPGVAFAALGHRDADVAVAGRHAAPAHNARCRSDG